MFSYFRRDIGIDLGTANVLVYEQDKGVVLSEPSVVAVDSVTRKVLAVGKEAKEMLGRSPETIEVIKPLKNGVISDYKITLKMLRHFINVTCGTRRFFRPRIMVCVPGGVTTVERKAVIDAAAEAGGTNIFVIDEPTAAAIGAGIDIAEPEGCMIIDIGGGTTDIAVISLGGIVASNTVKIAGEAFNDAIQKYIKFKYKVLIGESTAEELKINIGSVMYREEDLFMDCRGRHLVTGLPENIVVSSNDMVEALAEPMQQIVLAVKSVFENTPPEISSDIFNNGITLTGGGSLLHGLSNLIYQKSGVPCYVAENPMQCVAIGTGLSLQVLNKMMDAKKIYARY